MRCDITKVEVIVAMSMVAIPPDKHKTWSTAFLVEVLSHMKKALHACAFFRIMPLQRLQWQRGLFKSFNYG
jgi:hypothetical protein